MEIKELKDPVNIIVKVGTDIHKEIKMRAIKRNMTIKMWVLQAIFEKMKKEDERA